MDILPRDLKPSNVFVPNKGGVKLIDFGLARKASDDTLTLHGRADSFDGVEALRRALAASPLLADVASDETRTTVDGRQVEFRVQAARRPPGGAAS